MSITDMASATALNKMAWSKENGAKSKPEGEMHTEVTEIC
jgi:hypothetical protein